MAAINLTQISPEPIYILDDQSKPTTPFKKTLISILRKLQKYSAFAFTGFVGLHTTTVITLPAFQVPLGICQEAFEVARQVYTATPIQWLLTLSITIHVASGLALRFLANKKKPVSNGFNTNNEIGDEGLGGITSLIGLGTRKSIVSKYFGLTPLAFSGYSLLGLVLFHQYKFKWVPLEVDGDRASVSLQYVGVVLNNSFVKYGKILNFAMLFGLIVVGSYHTISGMLKLNRKFLDFYRKLGYGIIGSICGLGLVSMMTMKRYEGSGYLFKTFMKYVEYSRV